MLLIFRLRGHKHMENLLQINGYFAEEFLSALSVAIIMLLPQVILLMPLYAALVGGDLVAKEAEDGTLRMILSRPISRFRLLLAKWFAGVIFSVVLVTVLGTMRWCSRECGSPGERCSSFFRPWESSVFWIFRTVCAFTLCPTHSWRSTRARS